jgi:hypothetical protein
VLAELRPQPRPRPRASPTSTSTAFASPSFATIEIQQGGWEGAVAAPRWPAKVSPPGAGRGASAGAVPCLAAPSCKTSLPPPPGAGTGAVADPCQPSKASPPTRSSGHEPSTTAEAPDLVASSAAACDEFNVVVEELFWRSRRRCSEVLSLSLLPSLTSPSLC